MSRRAIVLVASLALSIASVARADDARPGDADAAAHAYDDATAAHERGDYASAARLFAKADELAPNAVALETALREAVLADLPDLAMGLVLRAARGEATPGLASAVTSAETKYAARLGTIRVHCDACSSVHLDGAPVAHDADLRVLAGAHVVELLIATVWQKRPITVAPGATVTVEPAREDPAPPTPASKPALAPTKPAPAPPAHRGIHPAWLTFGFAGTTALGIGSLVSYLDTKSLADELASLRDRHVVDGSEAIADSGRMAEARTYALEGLTAASGVVTVLVGVLAVDWRGGPAPSSAPAVGVALGRATLTWTF